MTYDIKTALTPRRDDGGIDHRYSNEVAKIISLTPPKALSGLSEFYNKTSQLENDFGGCALQLCISFWEASSSFDHWKNNSIRSRLKTLLNEVGFKPNKVSALLGDAELLQNLKPKEFNSDFESKEEYEKEGKLTINAAEFSGVFWRSFAPPYTAEIDPQYVDFSHPWWY